MYKKITYRIIAALLFAVMCVTAIPFTAFTVVGEGIDAALLQNPGALVGNIATLNIDDWANYHICDKPEAYDDAFWDSDDYWIYNEEFGEDEIPDDDMELVITNYYYDSEREYLWYSVKAAPGYELPEKLKNKPYIMHIDSTDVPVSLYISDSGKNYVFDQNGNAVTEATMSYYDTLTFCSKSTLQGKVSYKWQVYAEDSWVDIYGEEEADIDVNIGMLSSVLQNNTASVRCVSTSGSKSLIGEAITITIQEQEDDDIEEVPVVSGADVMLFARRRTVSDSDAMVSNVMDSDVECYITIKYLFEDGVTEAANPDVAQLVMGQEITTTFMFPKVQGYLPYYNEEQVDSLSLTGVKVTEDITYTVIYKPTDVEYQIAIYFQNIEDDGYTFQSVETLSGLTGALVPHKTVSYEGMYELLHETPEIAANGSTRVEVYFNRTYYLTRFDLDGGFGVYSMYARYGADLAGKIGTPVKPGYTFIGWDEITNGPGDGIADTIADTVPAESHVYKALWKMNKNAKVRVVYWGENPNNEEYAYLDSKELYVKPGTLLTFNSGKFVCDLEEHRHDGKCETVCGKLEEEHSESCYGNCPLASHNHTKDCYDNVGNRENQTPQGAPGNPDDGQIYKRNNSQTRYIYISGYWYRYNRNANSGTIIEPNASCAK
ncbi:MAG: InlB B-repeat-containing protein, partial [Lachnospiraceae bacterium]|nr:InlB B-repeat-containing protein [Lachnospiraceae bacterium]